MSDSASVKMPLELHRDPIMSEPDEEHPLLRDTDRPGWWGWIDKLSEQVSRHLNPILIKEARQSLKSRQFAVTFFLLLITSWFWMIIGVVTLAPDIYFVPSGAELMSGYYFLLAIPMIAMVPLAAHRSLAAELDEGTYELLAITKLTSMRIVTGKLGSAVLQMLVYFAALVPCFAFCYLLRGIDMVMIGTTIMLVFGVSILLTTFGLLLATVVQNRAGQIFTLLVLLGVIVFCEFFCGLFVLEVIMRQQIFWNGEGVVFTLLFSAVTVSCMVMFVRAAAARIAPITENRSTRLRWIMFAQQLIWIASIATLALWYSEEEVLQFGIMIQGGYWLLMGTLMLGESSELSPRVLRTLPQTTFGRMMMLWFSPGPGTGFMFAITTGCAGMMSLGMVAVLFGINNAFEPLTFAFLMMGYLTMFLGGSRLIVLPIAWRIGNTFAIPCCVTAALLALGVIAPSVFMAITTGGPSQQYGLQEFTNWIWTIDRSFSRSSSIEAVAFISFLSGGTVFVVNLFLLIREFTYRRVAIPVRVIADSEK